MRLIDANALSNRLGEMWGIPKDWDGDMDQLCEDAFLAIDEAPTIEAKPVRHGKWIDKGLTGDWAWQTDGRGKCWHIFQCSVCGEKFKSKSKCCPDCGVKMDGENE